MTYGELDQRSNRLAHEFRRQGLEAGDSVALLIENNERFFEVVWAAQRAGLYYTPINTRLTADEIAYIVNDCGARTLIVSDAFGATAQQLTEMVPSVSSKLLLGDSGLPGWSNYDEVLAKHQPTPIADECEGVDMLYSSGTTGRPKGVRRRRAHVPAGTPDNAVRLMDDVFGCDGDTVFLSTAPLYHGAPLILSMAIHRLGGTVVVMEKFDPLESLALIARYAVTHSQWVPTMFIRLLKSDPDERRRFDLSSHVLAIHGAGPCPIDVKSQMIEWWGPILYDYYSGTEGAGTCAITSAEWLEHKGSVGRPVIGEVHILDDQGRECAVGEPGLVYFAGGPEFEYHNDPAKTLEARNDRGWSTLGDIGYLDAEGYLYLTDRRAFTIVSGGVNVYPQEVENVLIMHPAVADVAVVGVPNDDLVEEVRAVVQPVEWSASGPELEAELIAACRKQLASYKCPRSIDFERELPRGDTGKLAKHEIRRRYWERHE